MECWPWIESEAAHFLNMKKIIGKVDEKVHHDLKKLSVELKLTMSDTIKYLLENQPQTVN